MNRITTQQGFLHDLHCLATMLFDHEADGNSPTLRTLLNEIRGAAAMIGGGCSPRACQDFAMRRLAWRVRYDLKDDSTIDQAMQLLQTIIRRGIELLRHIDWRNANSRVISTIAMQTGVDLGL
ncbi:MAG: hypothetical protein ABSG53_24605 [Thermoguttaceae bacterium]|jgi:hypothetical protein